MTNIINKFFHIFKKAPPYPLMNQVNPGAWPDAVTAMKLGMVKYKSTSASNVSNITFKVESNVSGNFF